MHKGHTIIRQLWCVTEVESRTQRSRPRPTKQKKSEAKANDRNARGQGQGPRTQTQVFCEKKVFKFFFRCSPKKNGLEKHFSADLQNFNHSKNSAVLEPRKRQFSRT